MRSWAPKDDTGGIIHWTIVRRWVLGVARALTPILVACSGVLWVVAYFTGSPVPAWAATVIAGAAFGSWFFDPSRRPVAQPTPLQVPLPEKPASLVPETLDASGVLRALLAGSQRAGRAVSAHLWVEDETSGRLRLVALETPAESMPSTVALDPLVERVFEEGTAAMEPVSRVTSGATTETVWRYGVPVGFTSFRGVVAVDLVGANEPDSEILNRVVGELRMSLVCAMVLHVSEGRNQATRVLLDATRDLSRTLVPEDVISASLARAMSLTTAATGSIMLLDAAEGRLHIAAAEGLPADVVRDSSVAVGEGIAGWVAASRQPLLVEDLPGRRGRGQRHGVRCALSVPVADQEGLLGVLNVGSRAYPAAFTDGHMEALEVLGRQTAVALRNARAVEQSQTLYFDTLKALALALETKDPYATGGTERIMQLVTDVGHEMDLSAQEQEALELAALLHDIGMAAVADAGVSAPGPLTTVERGLLKMHPKVAAEILKQTPALSSVVPIVFHHHERFDGAGYGGGVGGVDIPIGARILSVVDAFVAMTSDRPYRKAMPLNKALAELAANAGTQFDPDAVRALTRLLSIESDRVPQRDH